MTRLHEPVADASRRGQLTRECGRVGYTRPEFGLDAADAGYGSDRVREPLEHFEPVFDAPAHIVETIPIMSRGLPKRYRRDVARASNERKSSLHI